MKTVLKNAKIYIDRGEFAEAMLVDGGVVRAVGSLSDIDAADADIIDCGGRTVVPGFNDSHLHLIMYGSVKSRVQLGSCCSVENMIEVCREYIASHPDETANGLFGSGWNQDYFTGEKRIPNRHDLDKISTDIPVVLRRVCAHISCGNTKAIEKLGIDGSSPQLDGGTFGIGRDGYPDGVFYEKACGYINGVVPQFGLDMAKEYMIKGMQEAVSKGVTSVQTNDLGTFFDNSQALEDMVVSAYKEGRAPLRYHFQASFKSPEHLKEFCRKGKFKGDPPYDTDMLTMGTVKLFKDGSLGARTALLSEDYADMPGTRGIEVMDDDTLCRYIEIAERYHVRIATHVIGDEAARRVIACYERCAAPGNPLRHGLIHFQISDRAILEEALRANIYVQYQPIFLNYDHHIVEDRVGAELASTSYAFGSFVSMGGEVSFGTDCPVEDLNPFENIYCAVTRKDLKGEPADGWFAEERMDVAACIDAYTVGSARCQFMEDRKGRLKEGYLADLVLLSDDIFTCAPDAIKDIRSEMTMVGGNVVFSRLS